MSSKSAIQTQFMSFYIGKSYKFMSFIYVIIILKLQFKLNLWHFILENHINLCHRKMA